MRVTIKQIAEQSGLSVPTVSRILRDQGEAHQESTRQRVLEAARKLGYRPNSSARAMRRGRFDNIALLQSATDSVRSLLPVGLLGGIQKALTALDMRLSVAPLPDTQLTDKTYVPRILREWAADGLLINYNAEIPAELIALISEYTIPAIWINSQHSADCVFPDDEGAAYSATRYLLELSHTQIAYADFQGASHYSAPARRRGYERAMREAGLPPRLLTRVGSPFTLPRIKEEIADVIEGVWPAAVLTYGPETMRSLVLGATAAGLRVPDDLSLIDITFHNQNTLTVPIDAMILPEEEVGIQAVEMLMAKIAEPQRLLEPRSVPFTFQGGWTTSVPRPL